jgi:hypothetical protein
MIIDKSDYLIFHLLHVFNHFLCSNHTLIIYQNSKVFEPRYLLSDFLLQNTRISITVLPHLNDILLLSKFNFKYIVKFNSFFFLNRNILFSILSIIISSISNKHNKIKTINFIKLTTTNIAYSL